LRRDTPETRFYGLQVIDGVEVRSDATVVRALVASKLALRRAIVPCA
jgi:hypothetical protein